MPKKHFVLIFGFIFLLFLESCIPPRCRIPNCEILVDHVHRQYGREIAIVESGVRPGKKGKKRKGDNLTGQEMRGGPQLAESPDRWYRGLPWYMFLFRKRHQDPMVAGRYRIIHENEVQRFRKAHQASSNDYARYRKIQERAAKKRDKNAEKLEAMREKEEGRLAKQEEKDKKKAEKMEYNDGVEVVDDTEEGKKRRKNKKDKKKKKKSEEIEVEGEDIEIEIEE